MTRLGRGVDLTGQLSTEAIEAACEAIADYVAIYREAGIDTVDAIATSAVRDAANGDAFVAELRERFALSARVLDGEEEARLTYLGATSERPPGEPTLVVDIGGGSTELIVGAGEEIDFHASLQAGVVRHTERHLVLRPAHHRRAGGPGRRRAGVDRGRDRRPRRQAGGPRRDRRRRHPDLAGRDRDGARALRPRAGPRAPPLPAHRSSGCSRGSPRRRWPSGPRSPACTPTARRPSSPGS